VIQGSNPPPKNPHVNIGQYEIGPNRPVFFVAELGINHQGNIETAKKLIDIAVEAGAQAIKLQKRTIERVYTQEELNTPRKSVFGETNRALKEGLEFDFEEYTEIYIYCRHQKVLWWASPWDVESVDFLEQVYPDAYKIPSALLTDGELLAYIRDKKKPMILSTGMSTLQEIDHAVDILGKKDLILLHCVSTYPTENWECNLLVMEFLRNRYKIPVGYSGHEKGIFPSVYAAAMGAVMIERHISLDRTMWGSDQAASLEPKGLKMMIEAVRQGEMGKGDGIKRVIDSELPIKAKLRKR